MGKPLPGYLLWRVTHNNHVTFTGNPDREYLSRPGDAYGGAAGIPREPQAAGGSLASASNFTQLGFHWAPNTTNEMAIGNGFLFENPKIMATVCFFLKLPTQLKILQVASIRAPGRPASSELFKGHELYFKDSSRLAIPFEAEQALGKADRWGRRL